MDNIQKCDNYAERVVRVMCVEFNEQDKAWIEKCKEDWMYTIMVDNDEIFVVHPDHEEAVYTFSLYGYEFAKALLKYIGCDTDWV